MQDLTLSDTVPELRVERKKPEDPESPDDQPPGKPDPKPVKEPPGRPGRDVDEPRPIDDPRPPKPKKITDKSSHDDFRNSAF